MEQVIHLSNLNEPDVGLFDKNNEDIVGKKIEAIFTCLKFRDLSTAQHSVYMAKCAYKLAAKFDPHNALYYFYGGLVHDIGKIAMRDTILKGKDILAPSERIEVKEHVRAGVLLLQQLNVPEIIWQMALLHHESYDGSGYLFGLSRQEIPLVGRIAAVADVYSAIITERSYKPARTQSEAIEIMKSEHRKFDPVILEEFFNLAPQLNLENGEELE